MRYGENYSGIYKITNLTNGKIYIGQSRRVYIRKQEHFNALRTGKHPNKQMQKDFNAHHRFMWSLIELCPEDKLNEREIYWIKRYNSMTPNGYNQDWVPYKRKEKKEKKKRVHKYHKTS